MFIRVVPYDPFWEVEYENESQKIKNILKDILVEVYHIGSTAVNSIYYFLSIFNYDSRRASQLPLKHFTSNCRCQKNPY